MTNVLCKTREAAKPQDIWFYFATVLKYHVFVADGGNKSM